MTDTPPSSPMTPRVAPVSAPRPLPGRGLKLTLAVSVALNLAVAGIVAGAWIKDRGHGRGMPKDLSFGPFNGAFSPEDRMELHKAMMAKGADFRASNKAATAEFDALVAALRASPFDPAAVQSALAAVEARASGRLELGRQLIEDRILQMSETDRLAFAERLEDGLRHKKPE